MNENKPESSRSDSPAWWLYRGTGRVLDPAERDRRWPLPPRWRTFDGGPDQSAPPQDDPDARRRLGTVAVSDRVDQDVVNMVNAAIHLRRPLLATGRPGCGKSLLAYQIAHELGLGRVLRWPVSTRSTLQSGLYEYDAIGRVQATSQQRAGARPAGGGDDGGKEPAIGDFVHLGPLGTALLPYRLPRVLLIDDLDRSDTDLPNDLVTVFEEGEFEIRELVRLRRRAPEVTVGTADPGGTATIHSGRVRCHEFPLVIITSNDEREFPPAFVRRCLHVTLPEPHQQQLAAIVNAHFAETPDDLPELMYAYLDRRARVGGLGTDQLLNAIHLHLAGALHAGPDGSNGVLEAIWQRLSPAGPDERP